MIINDPETLDLITIILERQGYRVIVARDGLAGLESVVSRTPRLIITDFMMPQIDGIEMIKQIRALGPIWRFIPVLAVSAYQKEYGGRAIEAGASHVLAKPFEPQSLIACVKELLRP